ncbi:hypothetical protein EV363DRAFT_1310434 [Boletus edulis]|nr:hypothetical protein EV363DRAFT_1310434 [Boletus edulis]
MLEDARRVLASPILNFSERFPDDLLADSVARQAAANIRTSRFASSSEMAKEVEAMVEEYAIDDVWEESGMYVPARLLSPIPEESLADEFVVEEDAHSPPQSFKHAICFEERQWVANKVRITTKTEPPIPPTPPDVYLRQRRRRWKPPDPPLSADPGYLQTLRLTTLLSIKSKSKKKLENYAKLIRGDHGVKY